MGKRKGLCINLEYRLGLDPALDACWAKAATYKDHWMFMRKPLSFEQNGMSLFSCRFVQTQL
jgi:hypothetical protein